MTQHATESDVTVIARSGESAIVQSAHGTIAVQGDRAIETSLASAQRWLAAGADTDPRTRELLRSRAWATMEAASRPALPSSEPARGDAVAERRERLRRAVDAARAGE